MAETIKNDIVITNTVSLIKWEVVNYEIDRTK